MDAAFKNGFNNVPTVMIIFGVTGDLATRKIIPSLFHLFSKSQLPNMFKVIGFSRRNQTSDQFRNDVEQLLMSHADIGTRREAVIPFVKLFSYTRGVFEHALDYQKLADHLAEVDKEWGVCTNKLFYLAVPPHLYEGILSHLASSGLTEPCSPEEGWTRVIVEKPFGRDLKTAQKLDALLRKLFREEQIYRIDHYLGKETVQNILAFRFSNSFFGPLWNRDHIERVHIRFFEKDGVERRGNFYDGIGALRDVGQNHLLQLLALFTMENPGIFDAGHIRHERARVLSKLRIFDDRDVKLFTVRGQYTGYRAILGVDPHSATETYFHIRASIDTPRWQGVPFYLESGKRMQEEVVEVTITFAHPTPCLCPPSSGKHYKNVLRYRVQPHERITTSFWVKKPGPGMVLEEKDFTFNYREAFSGDEVAEAYEKLLSAAIRGDQTMFVSTDEIMASWKFIDPILSAWYAGVGTLENYEPDSHTMAERALLSDSLRPRPVSHQDKKEIAFIGLGKMGTSMSMRLLERGWHVVAYDKNASAISDFERAGGERASDLNTLLESVSAPRVVWIMVPAYAHATAGTPADKPVDEVLDAILPLLSKDDIVIDGGNSFFEDSIARGTKLARRGIRFLDVGVSGGPAGARNGASIMVGGDRATYERVEHLFRDFAVEGGYGHMGKSGAGHFVKMVHNGIEYGMMQALAEGFSVMKESPLKLDLATIADVYSHGSVITSRLVAWLKNAYDQFGPALHEAGGSVDYTGEGEWTVKTAKKLGVPVPVISASFDFRVKSAKHPSYAGKVLSALRNQFGGHSIEGKQRNKKTKEQGTK